jgi:hypothetical protein
MDTELLNYFGVFWREVYRSRGRKYYEDLKRQLVSESLTNKPFYSATEKNFRHFLHNLEKFKTSGNWRIPIHPGVTIAPEAPLPSPLEESVQKYGWKALKDIVILASLQPLPKSEEEPHDTCEL